MASKNYLLGLLPAELAANILQYVAIPDLVCFAACSKAAYHHATDFIWKDLILRDRSHTFPLTSEEVEEIHSHSSGNEALEPVARGIIKVNEEIIDEGTNWIYRPGV
jgi:hypothetical protein